MAGAKETPRQRMIGMMYLVLTALLALNVSKDILNAFVIVNEGLEISNDNTSKKNDYVYNAFKKSMINGAAKVKPFYDKAIKAQQYSKELVNFIEDLRTDIICYTEFGVKGDKNNEKWKIADTLTLARVDAKDNYDKPMEILIGNSESGAGGAGETLKKKLEEFKKNMLFLLNDYPAAKATAEKSFPINTNDAYSITEEKMVNWVMHNFYHTVLAADVAILNKLLIDVRTVEGDVISQLYSSVNADDFKFDKICAKVVPKSNYVLTGDTYEAQIFVAAYDSKVNPTIEIGSGVDTIKNEVIGAATKLETFVDGIGIYKSPASGVGEKKYGGVIKVVAPSGATKSYPFSSEYIVAQPSATVSADKMNVFYIGLDNPVSISVPGVASGNVTASMSGGSMVPNGNGKYTVRVSGGNEAVINVGAKVGGKQQSMGVFKYRIKSIPSPVPSVAGVRSGAISKGRLSAAPFVVAELDNFLFDGVRYSVTGFTFSYSENGLTKEVQCSGSNLSQQAIAGLGKVKPGQKVFFENIKAVGPDKTTRPLPSVILKLN
ncbi:MAG: gliding motility protein GldM [Bacteroidetes bacterium]|nr:gliding motility protein GldM [Bacteroidota bacterium]